MALDPDDPTKKRCVFCLGNGHLQDDQILWQSELVYLCAPRGQLVEGYLAIAPRRCVGSLSALSEQEFAAVGRARRLVESFYRTLVGSSEMLWYEQGRGGGGSRIDHEGGFPHHAHLCSLPINVPIHRVLTGIYRPVDIDLLDALPSTSASAPYVFVSTVDADGTATSRVYLPTNEAERSKLERLRLKPIIADLLGHPERGDWRVYQGDQELRRVIERFGAMPGMED